MKNKNIKNIFDEKISKKEIYNNVLNYKKENKINLIPMFVIVTTVLILAVIFTINNDISSRNVNLKESQDSEENILINEIENNNDSFSLNYENNKTSSCISDKTYIDYSTYEKEIMIPKNLSIPNELELRNKQVINYYFECKGQVIFYENTYSNKNMTKKIIIQYAEKDVIPNFNYKIDNLKTSVIEDTQMIIYLYKGSYIATFEYKSIYYKIESTNITKKEFVDLLKSVVKG